MKKLKETLQKDPKILILPLLALAWNVSVYSGGRLLAAGKHHYDMTLSIDRMTPFLPWTIVIYWGCVLFWIAVYLWMAAKKGETARHFFLMHFIGELICLLFFVLLPTTNTRPPVPGEDIWSQIVRLQYLADEPNNLFPSIHCMISWFCWIGLRRQKEAPPWLRRSALPLALAVFLSTLTLKQHVILDLIGAVITAETASLLADRWEPRLSILIQTQKRRENSEM